MRLLRGMVVGLVLAGAWNTARACLNDEESSSSEQEFRSQYYGRLTSADSFWDEFEGRRRLRDNLMVGGGAALLIGSLAVALRRSEPAKPA